MEGFIVFCVITGIGAGAATWGVIQGAGRSAAGLLFVGAIFACFMGAGIGACSVIN